MSLRTSLSVLAVAFVGCGNPSLDVKIAELGGEVPGVPTSEYHRAGQPCIDCHGPYKGAKPEMALAGTIFAIPAAAGAVPVPVSSAKITVIDALGLINGASPPATPPTKMTNCAGNFYFTTDELQLAFPYGAQLDCPDPADATKSRVTRSMVTRISREGSCNACHHEAKTQSSPGWIVCDDDAAHTGQTVYPPATHESCPQGVPATAGSAGVGP